MAARDGSEASGFWLANTPATMLQRRLTVAAMAVLLLIFIVAVSFANVPMAQSDGFIPFIQATMFVTELVTAVLLYSQFAIVRSRAILVLASGFLFTALIIMAHTLAFPRAFGPNGLLDAGLQTTGWLAMIWHFVFPASVIGYALMKDNTPDAGGEMQSSAKTVISWSVTVVFGLVVALTWGLMAGDTYVPQLMLDGTNFAPLAAYAGLTCMLMCALAFVLLWTRQASFLDRWLLIVTFAAVLEMAMLLTITGRFSLGWYAGRLFGVIASAVVLVALLTETMVLYARLANAIALLRRERSNRLMSLDAATAAMAHELRQPLAGIGALAGAGLNWLKRTPPDFEEARTCLVKIGANNRRADDIITSVRELFKRHGDQRTMFRVDDVARQVLTLVRQDLNLDGVSVSTEFQVDLPEVHADRTQLQQVILNLVKNSVDAMESTPPGDRRLRLATSLNRQFVVLHVQDSGPGITVENTDRVFEPFFTTKPSGMGLGLSICQTIVEEHGGKLRIAKTDSDGCVFEIVLPIAMPNNGAVRTGT